MTYLVVCNHYWGRGDTIDKAKAQAKKAGGSLKSYVVFESSDPKIHVDEMGYICYYPADPDHPEIKPYREVMRHPKNLK